MKTSIVVCCYNNLELTQATVESVLKHTTGSWELILVDNHSLDERTHQYIINLKHPNVKYIDAGENLGVNNGYNLGFDNADGDFLVKLDDDTVILNDGWTEHLENTYWVVNKEVGKCSMVATDCNVKHKHEGKEYIINATKFESVTEGTLGFSCVMFPADIYKQFGHFMSAKRGENSLYGGEESWYANLSREKGYVFGYDLGTSVFHQNNEMRDLDFVCWKGFYGVHFGTDKPLDEFKKDRRLLLKAWRKYKDGHPNNNWIQVTAEERINQLENEIYENNGNNSDL